MATLNSFSLGAFWPLVAGCIGGIFVLWGLAWEKKAEKYEKREKWDSKTESLVKWKHWKGTAGWWILMAGIAVEVGDAGWTAYEIDESSPLNQPIALVSATVSIVTSGNMISIDDRILEPGLVTMDLGNQGSVFDGAGMNVLLCSGWDWKRAMPNWYSLKFDQGSATVFAPKSSVRDAKGWNVIVLNAKFLPRGSEIVGGVIELTVNSTKIGIPIPAQKAKGQTDLPIFLRNPQKSVVVFGQ